MNTVRAEVASFEKLKDLKSLLSATGPCLSIVMPLSTAPGNQSNRQNDLHWKECLRRLESGAQGYGQDARQLVDSIASWDAVLGDGQQAGRSVAVFRSPEVFQVVWLDKEVKDYCTVGPVFYIRPLLAEMMNERAFYILALSQKNTRLLRCTGKTSEEVPFKNGAQTSFDTWMNQAKPDHNDRNKGSVGPSNGANKQGAIAPLGADREAKDEYLSHYFKQIDRALNEMLRAHTEPLVLAGVEYELPLYREVNSYPHLCGEAVKGAPDGLKGGEMHARALQALEESYANRVDNALAEWNHKVGAGGSSRLEEVVTAAHDGRVLTLVISDSEQRTGAFREETNTVEANPRGGRNEEELVNEAAVQTILHAGKVLVAPQDKMPDGAVVAATFRY
jgi:hypothetical protein